MLTQIYEISSPDEARGVSEIGITAALSGGGNCGCDSGAGEVFGAVSHCASGLDHRMGARASARDRPPWRSS
jgi:hypothetical protein